MKQISVREIAQAAAGFFGVTPGEVLANPGRGNPAPGNNGTPATRARAITSYLAHIHYGHTKAGTARVLGAHATSVTQHCASVMGNPDRKQAALAIKDTLAPPQPKYIWKTDRRDERIYGSPHKPPRGPQPPERERMAHLAGYR